MHGEGGIDCDWCDVEQFRGAELFVEGDLTFFASDAFAANQVLPGAGVVCPRAHRESPFELTTAEWAELQVTLRAAKELVDARLSPDGYNLIWNVMPTAGQAAAHVHLHLIPRFSDEPHAGRGARWMLRQPENRRGGPSHEAASGSRSSVRPTAWRGRGRQVISDGARPRSEGGTLRRRGAARRVAP